jgi:rubrerythrin
MHILLFSTRSSILKDEKVTGAGRLKEKGEQRMAFNFDNLTKKAKDFAAMAADKTKDAADQVKVNVAIAGEQREIDKNYRTIGEWFVNEYEGEIPDAVRELVEAVAASKARIAELEASKEKEEAEVAVVETVLKSCSVCGFQADSKFCPQCGAPMDAPAAAEDFVEEPAAE